jgi:subtilisin family serine protease
VSCRKSAWLLRASLPVLLAAIAGPSSGATGKGADALDLSDDARFARHPDRVLVRLKDERGDRWLERRGLRTRRRPRLARLRSVEAPPGGRAALREALRELRRSGVIEYAEPDYVVRALERVPNDPLFPQQIHLRNTMGGTDIGATQAWERTTGDPAVVVAVIDTGLDLTHPDLAANLWTNPFEVENGLDDDGNGYVDDIHGISCIDTDPDPSPRDRNGHGTHVSGILAAAGDNGLGVTGVAWRTSLMGLRFLGAQGIGFLSDAIECLDYAVQMRRRGVNVRVANNSWGGAPFSLSLRDAILEAHEAGILFVAAAGNDGANNDGNPHYPSGYALPNLIAVAASNSIDELSFFSNFGPLSVHLAAPGSGVLSTLPGGAYGPLSGTSMATPQVSGAAALIYARSPGASSEGVRQRLLGTVDSAPSLAGRVRTGGRLSLRRAVCDPGEVTLGLPDLPAGFRKLLGRTRVMEAELFDCGSPVTDARIEVFFTNGDATVPMRDDGVAPDLRADDGVYTGSWFAERLGAVTARVVVTRPGATFSRSVEGVVRVIPNYRVDTSIAFAWVETAGGTESGIEGDDDFVETPIGFPFALFAKRYAELKISSNGYLTFGGPAVDWSNESLPNLEDPNAMIAVYWDDLDPSAGGVIRYLREGIEPDRKLTIEWRDVPYFASTARATFQVTLYERDQHMELRYLQVESGDPFRDRGASASVGIEDETGRDGLLVSHDAPAVRNGDAIGVFLVPPFCAVGPDADGDGLCDPEDNCPYAPNGDQSDRGALGLDQPADGIGDVCQCGDVSGNGRITANDGLLISRASLGVADPGFRRPELCDVGGTPACTANDTLIVMQALLGLGPGVEQVCGPAHP